MDAGASINGSAKRRSQGSEEEPYRSALPAEDLGKATETLQAFMDYKRRLEPAQRDLGRYPSLGAVWKAVTGFVQDNAPVSNNDLDRREREAALAETDILFEAEGLIVAVPTT